MKDYTSMAIAEHRIVSCVQTCSLSCYCIIVCARFTVLYCERGFHPRRFSFCIIYEYYFSSIRKFLESLQFPYSFSHRSFFNVPHKPSVSILYRLWRRLIQILSDLASFPWSGIGCFWIMLYQYSDPFPLVVAASLLSLRQFVVRPYRRPRLRWYV